MRVHRKMFKGLFAVVAIVFAFSNTAVAEPVFDVSAGISADWRSDSNFYKDTANPKEVYTYSVSPSVSVGKETANLLFNFDYTATGNFYRDQDTVAPRQIDADEKDFIAHKANAKLLFTPIESLDLGIDAAYFRTLDPKISDALTHSTNDDEYYLTRFSPILGYRFGREGRLKYNMRYRNSNIQYDSGAVEGSEEHRGIFELGYELTAAINIGLEYQAAKMDYHATTTDYTTNQVKLVADYQFGPFSVEAGAGINDRKFDASTVEDMETGVYHLKFSLEGAQAKIAIGSEYNYNNLGVGDAYYTAHKATLDAEYLLAERIPLGLGGYYQESDYVDSLGLSYAGTTVNREDNVYHVEGSVGYKITERITFKVKGGYEDMQSNFAGKDYDNTFFLGGIEMDLYPR